MIKSNLAIVSFFNIASSTIECKNENSEQQDVVDNDDNGDLETILDCAIDANRERENICAGGRGRRMGARRRRGKEKKGKERARDEGG